MKSCHFSQNTMGLILWIAAGVAAFLVGRAVERNRPRRVAMELLLAIAVALLAGLLATALDFGGWKELDWRAGAFAGLIASAAIAVRRGVGKHEKNEK